MIRDKSPQWAQEMTTVEVPESEIEDIFAQYPVLLRRILELSAHVFLVTRQKTLSSDEPPEICQHPTPESA